MPTLTHLDSKGRATMVDVADKPISAREAIAEGFIHLQPATISAITAGEIPKGEVLNTARIAGILAAKRTGDLIPLCHPLPIESVSIDFEFQDGGIRIIATTKITAKTGVEMEALTAISLAALTIYDMCKAVDKTMVIDGVRLIKKTGGTKSNL